MYFKYEFVAHCKIHFFDLAMIKEDGAERSIIDFSFGKITVVEGTVYKCHSYKKALAKVAVIKSTTFEFPIIGFILTESNVTEICFGNIFYHIFLVKLCLFVKAAMVSAKIFRFNLIFVNVIFMAKVLNLPLWMPD